MALKMSIILAFIAHANRVKVSLAQTWKAKKKDKLLFLELRNSYISSRNFKILKLQNVKDFKGKVKTIKEGISF